MGRSKKSKRRCNTGTVLRPSHDAQEAAGPSFPACQVNLNPEGETSSTGTGHCSTDAASSENSMAWSPSSSEACRYFLRGHCWNGDACRFRHSESSFKANSIAGSSVLQPSPPRLNPNSKVFASPFSSKPKSLHKQPRAPQECLDFYRTGSCPRHRTCRYAHPPHLKGRGVSGSLNASDLDFGDLNILDSLNGAGSGFEGLMEERMANGGFTDDDIYELSLQGIKPWDPEAGAALAVLNGWDMDSDDGYGYDYFDDYLGRKMRGFGFY